MKYAFFKGCRMPHDLPDYEASTRLIFQKLEVGLVDLAFTCCGHQVKEQDTLSFVYTAIRNIALAEKQDLTIMTPCKCCFGNLMNAQYRVKQDPELKDAIQQRLRAEGLTWNGDRDPRHLLSVLRDDIGLDLLGQQIVKKLTGMKVAVHYGCHALRPSNVTRFDNPFAPTIFEDLIAITGAEPVAWSRHLECCGNPIIDKNRALSVALMNHKFESAAAAGADILCTACTYCQIQFETAARGEKSSMNRPDPHTVTNLLAESFGMT
jgi:heterodisulfide reductase subunit B